MSISFLIIFGKWDFPQKDGFLTSYCQDQIPNERQLPLWHCIQWCLTNNCLSYSELKVLISGLSIVLSATGYELLHHGAEGSYWKHLGLLFEIGDQGVLCYSWAEQYFPTWRWPPPQLTSLGQEHLWHFERLTPVVPMPCGRGPVNSAPGHLRRSLQSTRIYWVVQT